MQLARPRNRRRRALIFELRTPNFEGVFPREAEETTYASSRAFKKKLKKVKKSLVSLAKSL